MDFDYCLEIITMTRTLFEKTKAFTSSLYARDELNNPAFKNVIKILDF